MKMDERVKDEGMMADSYFRHELRYYPAYELEVDWNKWRELPREERSRRAISYSEAIRRALYRRVCQNHSGWNSFQHRLLFFKLCYAGEHFEVFANGQNRKGYLSLEQIQSVRDVSIPQELAPNNPYFLGESELTTIALNYAV
jgi:hypothetical protein